MKSMGFDNFLMMATSLVIIICLIGGAWAECILTVNKDNKGYTDVPQDIDTAVTCLNLAKNEIARLDSSSFPRYTQLYSLIMDKNPITEIRVGTFDTTPKLEIFECGSCEIGSFPPDFGPATTSLTTLEFKFGLADINVLGQLQLHRFTNLTILGLMGNPISDVNALYLPPTLRRLYLALMSLTTFPNLTSTRLPHLYYLRANDNSFQDLPDPFVGVSLAMYMIDIKNAGLKSAGGIETLVNLEAVQMSGNDLETMPDLLGLSKLRKVRIAGNSRMTCDHRMCWRRLLNRVRAPLELEDVVVCVHPPEFSGKDLSLVNPKFMECGNGKTAKQFNTWIPEQHSMECFSDIHVLNFLSITFCREWYPSSLGTDLT